MPVAGGEEEKQKKIKNIRFYAHGTLSVVGVTARCIRVRADVTTVEGVRGREGEAQSRPRAARGVCAPRRGVHAPRPRATKPRQSKLLLRAALAETVLGAARAVPPGAIAFSARADRFSLAAPAPLVALQLHTPAAKMRHLRG